MKKPSELAKQHQDLIKEAHTLYHRSLRKYLGTYEDTLKQKTLKVADEEKAELEARLEELNVVKGDLDTGHKIVVKAAYRAYRIMLEAVEESSD